MALRPLTVELPEEILKLLGENQPASDEAREAIILSLLRKAKISQGKAAELLGISLWDMMDLVGEQDIPTGPQTAEEIDREVAAIKRATREP